MNKHKYAELASLLKQGIVNGTYPENSKLPSENTLSNEYSLSRQTVRQAIAVLEKEGLIRSVRGSGTFIKKTYTRKKKTHNIAIVTTYIGEYIFPAILSGIESELSKNNYTSLLMATKNRLDNERHILEELLTKPIDGIIIEGTKTALPNPNLEFYNKIFNAGIPVVFINGYYSNLTNPVYVIADDHDGGVKAVSYLNSKSCTKIAGIFKSDDIQGLNRYSGYVQALSKYDIPISDDRVLWYSTETNKISNSAMKRILDGCDGVVCYNDEIAIQVSTLQKNGQISDKIIIVSFDNSTLSSMSPTPIYSLINPKEKIGSIAAAKLLEMIKSNKVESEILPWQLPNC